MTTKSLSTAHASSAWTRLSRVLAVVCGITVAVCGLPAQAERMSKKPHEHGLAFLDVSIRGDQLSLGLYAPMEALVGFEHSPRTPEQTAAAQALMALWSEPGQLIKPAAAAACTPGEPEAYFDGTATSEHSDGIGVFNFKCRNISALKTLEVLLLDRHPGIQRIEVEFVNSSGVKKQHLRRGGSKTVVLPEVMLLP